MRADATFWHAYAIRNHIESRGSRIIAAARAFSIVKGLEAVIIWDNGRETIFRDGMRI